MASGVSIIVCCHNSARLLPDTLARLATQRFNVSRPPCEILVVDNASTDQTAAVAVASWPEDCPIPLKVIPEPTLGLTAARLRGVAATQYEFISFIDDDNRVSPNWIETVYQVLTEHPEVGACGGQVEAESESALPAWFERFQNYYAVGQQAKVAGDVTESRGYLWGAGLCLRRKAWTGLRDRHFDFLLSDRKGESLSSGGDAELCYALRLAGWRLWYEPELTMKHFLPQARLNWRYLRRLSRAFGTATAWFDAYDLALQGQSNKNLGNLKQSWSWQTLATVSYLLRKPLKLLCAPLVTMEGDADALRVENLWGRLLELLKNRRAYTASLRKVSQPQTK